jgi:hypothetical protein
VGGSTLAHSIRVVDGTNKDHSFGTSYHTQAAIVIARRMAVMYSVKRFGFTQNLSVLGRSLVVSGLSSTHNVLGRPRQGSDQALAQALKLRLSGEQMIPCESQTASEKIDTT